jgi:rSAM/selenodomain-associated transferase 1
MAERAPPNSRRIAFAPRLIIMAKSPGAGQVKRRLGASLGTVAACNVYRSCLAHTLRRLSVSSRWRTVLAITPDADLAAPHWLRLAPAKSVARLGQGGGDLGRRMQRLFARLPPGPAIIIGSDIPSIRASHIVQAFRLLGAHDVVLGPAQDAGFWLVGLRRSPRVLAPFRSVRWSGPHALADTLVNLKGHRVALAATLSDIDTEEDYRHSRDSVQRLILPKNNLASRQSA